MAISGAQVPKAAIVRAISILGTRNFKARAEEASTRKSEAFIIITKPIINKSICIVPPFI